MNWLNYRHLLYVYTVIREGGVSRASEKLHLSQPTISTQVKEFEEFIGEPLLRKEGRGLVPTEAGLMVARYAEEIFGLGREMIESIRSQSLGRASRLVVGIADVVPKLIAFHLLEPVLEMDEPVKIECHVAHPEELLARLAVHELDLVISDSPLSRDMHIKAFNHVLGESEVAFFASKSVREGLSSPFPKCLLEADLLLPTQNTVLRRSLEHWFDDLGIRPIVRCEFEDSTYLKVFGQAGVGIFPAPAVIADDICTQFDVQQIGRTPAVTERFYAISAERRLSHPAVVHLSRAARRDLFD